MDPQFENDIRNSVDTLEKGGILLYPTDTVWGLGCDATNEKAVADLFAFKNRPDQQAMLVLMPDEKSVMQYIAGVDLAVFECLRTVKKPTTVIYPNAIGLASNLLAADGSIAIRICNEIFCKHLLKRFRKPLVSTSANFSGMSTPRTFKEIDPKIIEGAGYAVHFRRDDNTIAAPSSIIRWNSDFTITVIRP